MLPVNSFAELQSDIAIGDVLIDCIKSLQKTCSVGGKSVIVFGTIIHMLRQSSLDLLGRMKISSTFSCGPPCLAGTEKTCRHPSLID